MNWKKLREEEAEECFDRWRAEHVAEEGFSVMTSNTFADNFPATRGDFEISGSASAVEAMFLCGDDNCEHIDCGVASLAVKHILDYLYLRQAVRAHRFSKPLPVGGWSEEDRRLWDLVEEDYQ